jgi:phospholipid-binding lipoprotein MlaA
MSAPAGQHQAFMHRTLGVALIVPVLLVASGCATAPSGAGKVADGSAPAANPIDPWENWNRKVFVFNDAVDRAVLKPVAETYRDVVPDRVRAGVTNVLGNISDVMSAANQLLQGKLQHGVEMGLRVLANTFFGLGGLLDPATEMGLVKRPEDFGQTLGVWGVGNGPFMVLPFVGPSTVRDTTGFVVGRQGGATSLVDETAQKYAIVGLELVNGRARLLSAGTLVDQVALDKYSFIRDAYLSRRRDELYDGAPPMETFQDEPPDAPAPGAAPVAAPATSAAPPLPAASAPKR